MEDITYFCSLDLPWEKIQNKTIMISGASGQIGSMIIDVITRKNEIDKLNCKVFALGRNEKQIYERFSYCIPNKLFSFKNYDVSFRISKHYS